MKLQFKVFNLNQPSRLLRTKGQRLLLGAAGLLASLVLISCVATKTTLVVPPQIAGAKFVGSEACAECHETVTKPFKTAVHSQLRAKGTNSFEMGCESCHGAGSVHVDAGGGRGNIVNPSRSPQVCFECHLDKRGEFNLPFHHPVPEGRLSCSDCHDPHKGPAVRGMGTTFAKVDDTCGRCHAAQRGPFVFEHEAVREGCTSCHSVHGSVNNKLLTERNQTLCLKCHFQQQTTPGHLQIGGFDHTGFVSRGTCWSAGCHEAVHGSRVNSSLRY
jgi:predicted CXXCH cytochrome family protein